MPLKRKSRSKYNKKSKARQKKYKYSRKHSKKRRKRKIKRCRRSRKLYRRKSKRGYKRVQRGCAKQRGGSCVDYNCEYPHNMGSIITGTKNNLQGADLIPQTTQNRLPYMPVKQNGGALIGFDGLGTSKLIDFGFLANKNDYINYTSKFSLVYRYPN